MKILTKYTMREILGPFGAGVLFFTFVFVVQLLPEIFSLIIQNDVSPVQAFEIFMYTLPFNIGFILKRRRQLVLSRLRRAGRSLKNPRS
jgi:lipopolysaccharide export system permease protein